jgi:hypothetical protein
MIAIRPWAGLFASIALSASVGCRSPSDAGARDSGTVSSPTGAAVADAGPRACGSAWGECAPGSYCAFKPRLCAKGKRPGACEPVPTDCPKTFSPVCGCDGNNYDNECAARAHGVDLSAYGGCNKKIPDWMACGPSYCDAHTSYCEIVLSDVFELPTDYTCKPLPPACMPDGGVAKSCECFPEGTRCLSFCGPMDTSGLRGFHLTCRL